MSNQDRGYILAKRYRIERRLGAGTSATVFEAVDTHTGGRVAVKVVHHLFRKDRTIRKRFIREAEAARALATPHAVKVLDVGLLPQGIPYLVMELLEGKTLEKIVRRTRTPLSIEQTLDWTDQIAAGLQDAHGIDIIHRDLKPENIFVVDAGGVPFIKLVDFGISKLIGGQEVSQLTGTGVMVGTPVYMAPEQIEGLRDIDGRVDVYSLGVVMYEMLAGRSPFAHARDFTSLLRMLMGTPPDVRQVRPDVPEGLAGLVARAMAPDRAQRLPNMESVRVGIAPYWTGKRPSMHSYDHVAPLTDVGLKHVSVRPPAPSGPDFGELFEGEESSSGLRRRVENWPASNPTGGGAAHWEQPSGPSRTAPHLPPRPRISPSRLAPPPPPIGSKVPRPTRPPPPPPRPPATSDTHLVRAPLQSGVGPASKPPEDQRRVETDVEWPPTAGQHDDSEG